MNTYTIKVDRAGWYRIALNGRILRQTVKFWNLYQTKEEAQRGIGMLTGEKGNQA